MSFSEILSDFQALDISNSYSVLEPLVTGTENKKEILPRFKLRTTESSFSQGGVSPSSILYFGNHLGDIENPEGKEEGV